MLTANYVNKTSVQNQGYLAISVKQSVKGMNPKNTVMNYQLILGKLCNAKYDNSTQKLTDFPSNMALKSWLTF